MDGSPPERLARFADVRLWLAAYGGRLATVTLRGDGAVALAQGRASVSAEAINDYRAVIPAEDFNEYDVLVAWHLDDAPMLVRDKGPLVIIYPFDAHAKLRSAVRYGRAVWQLKALDVR